MRKSKKKKVNRKYLLFILGGVVGVFGLSSAYAALTTALNIVGSSEVKGNNWKISMEVRNFNVSSGHYGSYVPSVDGHRIKNIYFDLNVPGDYMEFQVVAHNESHLIAELNDIIVGTPVCTSDMENREDEELVCDNIKVTFSYNDGSPVEKGDLLYQTMLQDDGSYSTLSAICKMSDTKESLYNLTHSRRIINVRIEYDKNIDKVPSSLVEVSGLDLEFVFGQTDKKCNYEMLDVLG